MTNFKPTFKEVSGKYGIIILSLFYLLASCYLFNKYGLKLVNDSPRYIAYAENLQNGFYFDPLNFWYLSFAIFVMINQVFFNSLLAIIISQYVIGYLAVIALYHAVKIATYNPVTAFLASALFILFPDNLFWHSYILTESLYISFLCFSFFALVKYYSKKTLKNLAFAIIILTICFFCRPTSPALFLAILTPAFIRFLKNPAHRLLKISGCVIFGIALLVLANQIITMHSVMLIYTKGDIIFAMHETAESLYKDLMMIDAPEDLFVPDEEGALIYEMASFVLNNPLYWFKLFTSKLITFISHIRPYWSWMHNIYALLIIWPCYFLSVTAFRKKLIPGLYKTVILSYCIIHTLIVCNTWVDWDARFFVSIYPVMAYVSGLALENIINSKNSKDHLVET
ncbi:glycosyltransferase family 39 protein [Fulvivirga lutimaris]|uniref:glycosyltransferase family 39 protein n=1 Tax=Fulvivirga lutimaris TaxID=1819566 RepID=UPI0012BC6719|nr:glycosyltransferase family 39 protein [Fulvivirga lutimaris]MTI38849.1 hypothetical protein [Fulvivirga lutimaris]